MLSCKSVEVVFLPMSTLLVPEERMLLLFDTSAQIL